MRFGLDYAWGTIGVNAHKAIGSSFACRYLSHDASKNLSRGEAEILRTGGIDVAVVWETTAMRSLDGEGAGVIDAQAALAQAAACGMPKGRPIYFAVDFDETPGEAAGVAEYFKGVGSVLGAERTGVYGGYWVVKRLLDAKLVHYAWQTYAWSGGNLDHRAQIYQYSNGHRVNGIGCDYNHSFGTDFGQWGYTSPVVNPTGPKGEFKYEIQANFSTGEWRVRGLPGSGVALGGPDRWASATGGADSDTGKWTISPAPWNNPPLGG